MADTVKVFTRFRPPNASESQADTIIDITKDKQSVQLVNVNPPAGLQTPSKSQRSSLPPSSPQVGSQQSGYTFDGVFGPHDTQYEIYEKVGKPILKEVMDGFNGSILCYGQTSSGKTYTMNGPESLKLSEDITESSQHGIIPRLIDGIFDHIDESDEAIEFTLKISIVEIYIEKIRDLLNNNDNLKIRESDHVWIEDLTQVYVTSIDEILNILQTANENRMVSSTLMNDASSRSHLICLITIGQHNTSTGEKKGSQLVLVDLAGSEKVSKTGAEGQTLKEAQHINKSLSALGNVINACASGSVHVPYRDSKLTRILTDSIGGNSKTALIITCSPSIINADETISTLRFGQRAKRITNKPVMNKERSTEEYKQLLLSTFRIVLRRTKLLGATREAVKLCVDTHPQEASTEEAIQYAYEKTHNPDNPQQDIAVPANIMAAVREICDYHRDYDVIQFIEEGILSQDPHSTSNSNQLISPHSGGGSSLFANGQLSPHSGQSAFDLDAANLDDETLQGRLTIIQQRNQRLLETLHNLEQETSGKILQYSHTIEEKEQEILKLQGEVTQNQLSMKSLRQNITTLTQQIEDAQQQYQTEQARSEKLAKQIGSIQNVVTKHELTIQQLTKSNQERQELAINRDLTVKQQITTLRSTIDQQKGELSSLQAQLKQNETEKIQATHQIEELTLKLESTTQQQKETKDKLDYLSAELTQRTNQCSELQAAVNAKDDDIGMFKEQIKAMKLAITTMNENSSAYREQSAHYEKEMNNIRVKYDMLLTDYQKQQDLSQNNPMTEELKQTNLTLEKTIQQHQIDHETLKQRFHDLESTFHFKNAEYKDLQEKYTTMQARLHDADRQISDRSARLTQLQRELDRVLEQQQESKAERKEIQEKLSDITDKHASVASENALLQQHIERLSTIQAQLQDEKEKLESRLDQVLQELEAVTTKTEEGKTANSKEQQQLQTTIHRLETDVERLQTRLTTISHERSTIESQHQAAQQQLKDMTAKHNQLQLDYQRVTMEKDAADETITKLQGKYDKFQTSSQQRFSEFEQESEALQKKVSTLKEELKQSTTETNELKLKIDSQSTKLSSHEKEFTGLSSKYDALSTKYDTLVADHTKISQDFSFTVKKHSSDLEQQQDKFYALESEYKDLQQRFNDISLEFTHLQSTHTSLKDGNEELIASLRETITTLTTDKNTLENAMTTLQHDQKSMMKEHTNRFDLLESQYKQLVATHAEFEEQAEQNEQQHRDEFKQLMDDHDDVLKALREEHEETIQHNKATMEGLESKINDLQEENEAYTRQLQTLQQRLDDMKQEKQRESEAHDLAISQLKGQQHDAILQLREDNYAQIKQYKEEISTLTTELNQTRLQCEQLSDLTSIQTTESQSMTEKMRKLHEHNAQLTLQWEQNIVQQLEHDQALHQRIETLEQQLSTYTGGVLPSKTGSTTASSDDKSSNSSGGGLSFFKKSNKTAEMKKQHDHEIEQYKQQIEKKNRQHDRLTKTLQEKCTEYEDVNGKLYALEEKYAELEKQHHEMKQLLGSQSVLVSDLTGDHSQDDDDVNTTTTIVNEQESGEHNDHPAASVTPLALYEENQHLKAKLVELQEINKRLMLLEYQKKKNNVITSSRASVIHRDSGVNSGNSAGNTTPSGDAEPIALKRGRSFAVSIHPQQHDNTSQQHQQRGDGSSPSGERRPDASFAFAGSLRSTVNTESGFTKYF